ncbi:hypothetical protein [uncultured Ruminococcus sp.]|uniref:hypothetical protein n=1 Tax=uncultured Ruminococcus sp. TaxID=165186 RepID=UPI0025CBF7D9|nr:hypothetical protein [uncultured Ruminococcus sp.]
MKCSKCNKTWSLFDEKLSDKQHCPHCKEKFISKFQYFDSVSEGIAYCLEMGGKEILKNKSKMNAYINDLMGNDFPDHNLVKNAIDSDIGSILIDANEKDEKAKQAAVQQAIGRLIREFSTEKKKAEEVVTYFTDALQWKLPAAAAEKTGAVNAAANPAAKTAAPLPSQSTQKRQPAAPNASQTSPNPAGQNATFSPAAAPGTAAPQNAAIAGQPNPAATPNGQNPRQQAPNATFQGAQPYPVPPVPNGQVYPNGTIAPQNANGALQNNPNGTLNPENAAVKKKKKSPLGCLIAILILLLLLAGLVIWYLMSHKNEPEQTASTPAIVAEVEESSEASTEPETESEEETTEAECTMEAKEEQTTETTTETTDNSATYEVKSLAHYNKYDGKQKIQYDPMNNRIYYYMDTRKIAYYDLNTDQSETVLDLSETEYKNDSLDYGVNPFNGKVYADIGPLGLYDIEAKKVAVPTGYDPSRADLFFPSSDEVLYQNSIFSLSTGEQLSSGEVPYDGYTSYPFLYNNEYYYLMTGTSNYRIVKTTQLLTSNRTSSVFMETNINENKPFFVDTDAVYYMTEDHSIYQVDLGYQESEEDVLNRDENHDILIVDGKDIENSSTNYLSDNIVAFTKIDDSTFAVLDGLDNSLKLVSTK